MTEHPRVKALNSLLNGCLRAPAAAIQHDEITADLPEGVTRLLNVAGNSTVASDAWSILMRDFGARLFRRLLTAGQRLAAKQQSSDTDLDYNRRDLRAAEDLLKFLMVECANSPFIPNNVAALLGRTANALHDVREGHKPGLFDLPIPTRRGAATAAHEVEGRLAAALNIVVAGGTRLAAAKRWLDDEMRAAGIVDVAGDPVRAERVASWRNNFRKGIGARGAREWFASETDNFNRALGRDPAACQDHARKIIRLVAKISPRTAHPPIKVI